MKAALEAVEGGVTEDLREQAAKVEAKREARRKRRKDGEVKRRFVVTLSPAETEWVHANHERLGYDSAPAFLRDMAFAGLKACGGPSARQIEIEAREAELARLRAEEAEAGS